MPYKVDKHWPKLPKSTTSKWHRLVVGIITGYTITVIIFALNILVKS